VPRTEMVVFKDSLVFMALSLSVCEALRRARAVR
jgi:hypothetical protein